jgi:hypothetical protein
MSLLEIFMIEDFCDSIEGKNKQKKEKEDKGIGIFGFIFMVVAFAFIRDFFAERFAEDIYHLGFAVLGFTILIPLLIKNGNSIIAKIIFVANVTIGFIFYSVLLADFMQGVPLYTIVQENMAFINTVSIKFLHIIGKIILVVLTPVAFVLDVVVIPLAIIPFIQRQIWKFAFTTKN